jgi:hypothetical protein
MQAEEEAAGAAAVAYRDAEAADAARRVAADDALRRRFAALGVDDRRQLLRSIVGGDCDLIGGGKSDVDLLVALANEAVRTRFIGTSSSPPPHFERSTLRVSSKEEVLFERARRREGEVRVEAAEARAAAAERTADRMAARLAAWSRQ